MIPALITTAFIIFFVQTFLFFVAWVKKDNSIMDIFYGLVFVAASFAIMYLFGSDSFLSILISVLILLWGTRLSLRIFLKNKNKGEDRRYALWREEWSKKGKWYLAARSYGQVFLLQGFIIFLVSIPITVLHTSNASFGLLQALGVLLWAIGFFFEVVSDYQLDSFLRKPENKGKIMTEGLFRYSRRPNYFGESLMWWGIAVMAFFSPEYWYVFVSPIVITYIVVFVTGPITEKMWDGNVEYAAYKEKTSYFFPLPPKQG